MKQNKAQVKIKENKGKINEVEKHEKNGNQRRQENIKKIKR